MTISNSGTPARAAGNGVTTVFNFSFEVFASTDLVVRDIVDATGVATTKTLTTDYSVAISATAEGGTVTFVTAPAAGHTVDIRSVIPLQQPTSIRNQGPFNPEIHESVFDRLERQIQDTRRLGALALRLPDSELPTTDWDTIFDLASRKGKYGVFFNATTGAPELYASIGATTLTQSVIGSFLYPRTAAEIAAGVTPTQYFYPEFHPFRYMTAAQSADVVARTRAVDVTAALQAWINYCYLRGAEAALPAGDYAVSAELLLTMPGNRTTQNFVMRGAGAYGTRICRIGSQTSMLRFLGTAGPSTETNILLEDFAVVADQVGAASILRNADAVTLQNVAIWNLRNVRTQYCRVNLLLDGALVGHAENCMLSDGRIGVKTTNSQVGVYSDCNTVTISGNSRLDNNLEYGFDIGYASMLYIAPGVNVERNGIDAATVTISQASPGVVTYAGSGLLVDMPVVFTTTGGLPTGLTAGTTYYVKTVLTANTFTVSATIGGAAINTSSAGSGTHTCTPQTHGVIVRSTCDDLIGTAAVHIEGLWIESNKGGWGVFAEALGECSLTIERCELLQTNAVKVTSGRAVAIRDMVGSSAAIYDITCEHGELRNFSCNTLAGTITYPDFVNLRTTTQVHAHGRVLNYTGTLTGCTTSPTITIATLQRGKTVTLTLSSALVGTSNTTAATITGMPAGIRPGVAKQALGVNTDNGVDKFSQNSIGTDGVITLTNAFTAVFTNVGTKGAQVFRMEYEIA